MNISHEQAYEHFTAWVDRILKQCDDFSATVQEGSKLLRECRENLDKALKEISPTGDFAQGYVGEDGGYIPDWRDEEGSGDVANERFRGFGIVQGGK